MQPARVTISQSTTLDFVPQPPPSSTTAVRTRRVLELTGSLDPDVVLQLLLQLSTADLTAGSRQGSDFTRRNQP